LVASEELEQGGGDMAAWTAQAQEELKAHPEGKYAPVIKEKLESNKAVADLKSKPLDLKFTAVDGREVDLSKMSGKVVLIDFWATWCGPCVGEVPNVVKTYEKLHAKGFEIVGISLDQDKSKLEGFTKEKNMSWAQYFDGKGWGNEISTRFGIKSIPAMWLVNKKGLVVSTNARGKLEAEVEKLLAE
ncbi:MAG: TlpA disulfide reductase family protein, partial [Verrucomicrobiaceae bacterium]